MAGAMLTIVGCALFVAWHCTRIAAVRQEQFSSSQPEQQRCVNPLLVEGFEGSPVEDMGAWELVQVTDMQRHTSRWLYPHSYINNRCWPDQTNSSELQQWCDYNRSTIWQNFSRELDPYSRPLEGWCTLTQASEMGSQQAFLLGEAFRTRYGGLTGDCPVGSVHLHVDAVQKNERTGEEVYRGLCGRLPTLEEFPRRSTLVEGSHNTGGEQSFAGETTGGAPFWVQQGVCSKSGVLREMSDEAKAALQSQPWFSTATKLANDISTFTQHGEVDGSHVQEFLDNIVDCTVVHGCGGLPMQPQYKGAVGTPLLDTPSPMVDPVTRLPGGDTFTQADKLESRMRQWPYIFFKKGSQAYQKYTSLQYGYYFAVALDRMAQMVEGMSEAPRIIIQIMSDGNITPQLKILGLESASSRRPPYLSTLIFELFKRKSAGEWKYAVHISYQGKTEYPCPSQHGGEPMCPWEEFRDMLIPIVPTAEQCVEFWSMWSPKSTWGKKVLMKHAGTPKM